MAIEIIDTLKQKNGGSFPIVDSNDIKGGFFQVLSISERDTIPESKLKIGTLCYVEETDTIYKYTTNRSWEIFKTGVGGGNGFHIGPTPPSDVNLMWVDTSSKSIDETLDIIIINELRAIILAQNIRLLDLEERLTKVEASGGGGGGTTSNGNFLLLEDGGKVLVEEGSKTLLEKYEVI